VDQSRCEERENLGVQGQEGETSGQGDPKYSKWTLDCNPSSYRGKTKSLMSLGGCKIRRISGKRLLPAHQLEGSDCDLRKGSVKD